MEASLCSGSSSFPQVCFEGRKDRFYCRLGRELLGLGFIVKDGEGGCCGLEGATQVFLL